VLTHRGMSIVGAKLHI